MTPDPKYVHLLIVDDFPEDLERLRDMAAQRGYVNAVTASDAAEALRHVENGTVDCALIDYRLGAESGLDLLRTLQSQYGDIAVIMLSGAGSEQVAAGSLASGATRYMAKRGLDPDALASAIESALRWKSYKQSR